MGIEPSTDVIETTSNRKVWLISKIESAPGRDPKEYEYEEVWRGTRITVPCNREKKVVMPWLAAKRFLSQPVAPSDPFPNGGFINPDTDRVEKHRFGKPLEILEFTEEEAEMYGGMTPKEVMAKHEQIEKQLAQAKHTRDNQEVTKADGDKPPTTVPKRRGRPPKVKIEEHFMP